MPATYLFRAGTVLCLFVTVGCQSTGSSSWQFWRAMANDPKADLKDPERLHLAYGKLSEQTGDYSTARDNYETALRQNGQAVEAMLGLARLDLLANRPAEAEQRFRKAAEIAPSNPLTSEALGQFYLTQNRYGEAAAELKRGLAVAPNNQRLRHRLGIALARSGNIVGAEPHFVQAVGDAEADYNIGLILYEQGHIAESEQRFLQAVLKKPTLAPAQHWLDAVRQEQNARSLLAGAPNRQNAKPNPPAASEQTAGRTPASQPSASQPSSIIPTGGATTATQSVVTNPVLGGSPPQAPIPRLNPSKMSATQLEQLENSLTPAERVALRERLRTGQIVIQ